MSSGRDLRRRIASIRGTAQITRAMQMVAAAKMRRAQQAAIAAGPFARTLYRIQRHATAFASDFTHPLLEVREVRRRAVILIAADKGLCGGLNATVFRVATQFDPESTIFIAADLRRRSRVGQRLARTVPGAAARETPASPINYARASQHARRPTSAAVA